MIEMGRKRKDIVVVKPCGCAVTKGGLLILCAKHRRQEEEYHTIMMATNPQYREMNEKFNKLVKSGVLGKDPAKVRNKLLEIGKVMES
jgi:hypothetical protein